MLTVTPGSKLEGIKGLQEVVPLSQRTLQDLYRNKGMPHVRIGGRVLFDVAEVINWLKNRDQTA